MFYVHLFLKAMYRKIKIKINFVFPKICLRIRLAVKSTEAAESRCITCETGRADAVQKI